MELFITLLLFCVGFFILIKGANWLVSGARSIARVFEVSPWFVGLVIVGIGTSIPEFSINVASVFNGQTIGLETIIGSNTFNILVILGVAALVTPIVLRRTWVVRDLLCNIGAIAISAAVILLPVFGGDMLGVTRLEALFLFLLFLAWMGFMFYQHDRDEENADYEVFSGFVSMVFIVAGLVGVFVGGQWVVSGAEAIASSLGVSSALIALTLVAAGTSLPELTVSLVALLRRQGSLAVGNVIGSNIFDFLGIIGITALLRPIVISERIQFDIFAALCAALLLLGLVLIARRPYTLSRVAGGLMVTAYLCYLLLVLYRG